MDQDTSADAHLERLVAQDDIREVLHRYCRGVDRRQYELVRSCYHPDAVDHHGPYVGGVDGFVEQLQASLGSFTSTMHHLGNVTIDVDGSTARAESYLVAYHRLPADDERPERDFIIGGRYVDDFEHRNGAWRIQTRVCVVEWGRIDPVADGAHDVVSLFSRGRPDGQDPVFAVSLVGLHADPDVELGNGFRSVQSGL